MAEWVWEGRTRAGELRKGVLEAESEREVQQRLRQQNIMAEKVKQKRKGLAFLSVGRCVIGPAGRLRASVCDDDRRGPPARPVPGHSFVTGTE